MNDNAYKIDLPGEYNVSATFNITDLTPFDVGEILMTNPFPEEGNDEDIGSKGNDPIQISSGPITRARAKQFNNALRNLIVKLQTDAQGAENDSATSSMTKHELTLAIGVI